MFTISWNSSSCAVLQELGAFRVCMCSSKWHSWLKGEECNCISATWFSLVLHVICTWRQSAMPCHCYLLFMFVCVYGCARERMWKRNTIFNYHCTAAYIHQLTISEVTLRHRRCNDISDPAGQKLHSNGSVLLSLAENRILISSISADTQSLKHTELWLVRLC